MTALAIPEPTALVQSPDALCSQVEAWADTVDSVDVLNDAKARMQAIDTYLARTSTVGRQRVAATLRRLEVRIGELLGPAENHGRSTVNRDEQLSRPQRSEFRKMAEHADVVEKVIGESTDDDPASRRKVVAEIDRKIGGGIPAKETPPEREELFKALRAIGDMERAVKQIDPRLAAKGADPLKLAEINLRIRRLTRWLANFQQALPEEA